MITLEIQRRLAIARRMRADASVRLYVAQLGDDSAAAAELTGQLRSLNREIAKLNNLYGDALSLMHDRAAAVREACEIVEAGV